jgi:hypothetical protein
MRWPCLRPRRRDPLSITGTLHGLAPDLSTRGVRRLRRPDHYLSMRCYHDEHAYCPRYCEICDRPCVCECHEETE